MYNPVDVVEVKIWNKTVGAVARDPATGYYAFEYASRWANLGIELSPIHLPVAPTVYVFTTLPEATYKHLPAMLADALPDDFGNALIDAYMANQGVSKENITPLDRLAYMAKRSMGALEFSPARGPRTVKASAIAMADMVASAREVLSGKFTTDDHTQAALMNLIQVGTSAGGARAKAVIAWNPATNQIMSGQVPTIEGFDHWLLKFDGVGKDHELGTGGHYGRIEYAYHLMACTAGIRMMDCRLLEENGRAHFMTRRFDRDGNQKHHVQSLCGLLHLDFKLRAAHDYAQLFLAMHSLGLDDEAKMEGFRRMVFNVLSSNCDDHTKNLAFMLKEGGNWELAPAYDLIHAYNPAGEWTYQHLMSVNGKFKDITLADLIAVGERFAVPDVRALIRQVHQAIAQWSTFAAAAGLPPAESKRVQADFPDLAATARASHKHLLKT